MKWPAILHIASILISRFENIPTTPITDAINKLIATSTGRSRFINADQSS